MLHDGFYASYWAWQLAPFVVALVAYAGALFVMNPAATGDEPHYLVAAQSVPATAPVPSPHNRAESSAPDLRFSQVAA